MKSEENTKARALREGGAEVGLGDSPRAVVKPFSTILADGLSVYSSWLRSTKRCKVPAVTKKLVYSRGNNDLDEMTEQHEETGNTYQYETGRITLTLDAVPFCYCVRKRCIGHIALNLAVEIRLEPPWDVDGYVLLAGPGPGTPTQDKPGVIPPEPDLAVSIEKVDLPQAEPENEFTKDGKIKNVFVALASHRVPCTKGTYARRFYIVEKAMAGKAGVTPGEDYIPVAFVDTNVTIAETKTCDLTVTLKAYFIEFVPDYDFTHGGAAPEADDELPEVDHTLPDGTKGSTNNIAKLIEEDGSKLDDPFPPKP